MTSTRDKLKRAVSAYNNDILEAKSANQAIARQAIPEFHFMSHQVSDFWDNCKTSPIGYCVWKIEDGNFRKSDVACMFCGEPAERK